MKTDHMNSTLSKKNRGFSLIEVLIAMAIFSIGILAVGSMQLWNSKNNSTGHFTTEATMLARQKIEELKAVPDVGDLASGEDTLGIYTRSWVPGPCSGDACQIKVTVSWNGRSQARSVELVSITRGNKI